MSNQNFSLKLPLCCIALVGSFLAPFYASYANAEKYFTWVDEMGRVNHTVIPEEENPLIKSEAPDEEVPALTVHDEQKASPSTEGSSPSHITEDTAESQTSASELVNSKIDDTEKNLISDADAGVLPAAVIATGDDRKNQVSAVPVARKVEINEDDYIDGDVLLQQGNIRDENDLPYFTWTDEQGIVRNTPYRPKASTVTPKTNTTNTKKEKPEIIYTVYEEYRRPDQTLKGVQDASPQKIDSFAQQLFFNGQADSFIDNFSSACCIDLPKESPSVLDFEDSVYVELDKSAESYQFSEGKSPFKLVELPKIQQNYSLKLKTFVKTSGKTGVKNGVFFPQIVFLDDQFQVVRIVRNPVLEYVPENWRRHGYLKGLFEVDGRENERYLLINTTKESLKARNRIENKTVVLLTNQKTGSFEIEALKN